ARRRYCYYSWGRCRHTPMTNSTLPRVVIVGRANVGKSTLFNRIYGTRKAIVSEVAGTTRNALSAPVSWQGASFLLFDSGGLLGKPGDAIEEAIDEHTASELKNADLVLLLVDTRVGLLPTDRIWAERVRKSKKPMILVANKADSMKLRNAAGEFVKLGLGEATPASGANGSGIGDLLDKIVGFLPSPAPTEVEPLEETPEAEPPQPLRVVIAGRPNVGKSSLMNALAKSDISIASAIPHTTRDIQEHEMMFQHAGPVTLVDTAGMRRKLPVLKSMRKGLRFLMSSIEVESVHRTHSAIRKADVVLLVLDVLEPASTQDRTLARMIVEERRACVILLNKADLLNETAPNKIRNATELVAAYFPHLAFAPTIAISCETGYGISSIGPLVARVADAYQRRLTDDLLAEVLKQFKTRFDTPRDKIAARRLRFLGLEQSGVKPPLFTLIVPNKTDPPPAALPMLEKTIRSIADFTGSPIRIIVHSIKNI
ncbi:MAG: ribosome biogenesis GTPase Der, partial [bacterium]|nr:ribosome biogenesis GTPase Der [bacterium]